MSIPEEKFEDLEIDIEPEKPKEILTQQVQDRSKLLVLLADASKKRRSKNVTSNTLKEMAQSTELLSKKRKCI